MPAVAAACYGSSSGMLLTWQLLTAPKAWRLATWLAQQQHWLGQQRQLQGRRLQR